MTKLKWDQVGEKVYETGVSNGVLFIPNNLGIYEQGSPWNGLISVSEKPSGAESNKQYANNKVYANLLSAEEFSATIQAYTYPDEFAQCDGTAEPVTGVYIGQQQRKSFGLSYETIIGNDTSNNEYGSKIHMIYGALAAPTEKTYNTVNESPELATFSWELSTTAVEVPGLKPSASIIIDSTKVPKAKFDELKDILYGTVGSDPRLPSPAEVIALFEGEASVEVRATTPTYDSATDTITVPTVTGVEYRINGEPVTGSVVIAEDTVVTAVPVAGYKFPAVSDNDWYFDHT